jgi:hypothetical protein
MHKHQIERVRAREERRRSAHGARRERMRAESDAATRRAEDEARAQEARLALSGWSLVEVARRGPFWVVAGRAPDDGAAWSTACADPVAAAQRLAIVGNRQCTAVDSRQSAVGMDGPAQRPPPNLQPPTADCRLPIAGVMIERDEIARLQLALSMEVDRTAAALIAARNPNDAADVERARDLNNLLMLGLISDAQRGELDGLNARVGWARRVEEVAREAKRAIADAPAAALESFDVGEVGWPA